MRKIFCLSLFLAFVSHILAQGPYAYDWVPPIQGKPVLEVKVWEDGLYRISRQDVDQLNPTLAAAPADSLRLFFRGKEVPLHILFQGNPTWTEIEFFGKYHDGADDQFLYRDNITGAPNPFAHTNPRASLFTDTATYFLIATGGTPAQRWKNESDFDYSQKPPEDSLTFRASINFLPSDSQNTSYVVGGGSAYDSFNALNSDYVMGEGYVSRASFSQGAAMVWTLQTPKAFPGNQPTIFSSRVFGRSNSIHRLRVSENLTSQTILDTSLNSNQVYLKTYQANFSTTLDDSVEIRFEALGTGPSDNNHLLWIDLRYPRLPDMDRDSAIRFENVPAASLLRLEHCLGGDSVWAFSMNTGQRFQGIVLGDTAWLNLSALALPSDVEIRTDFAIKKPLLEESNLTPLCHPDSGADMILLAHRSLEASARVYADFRDSSGFVVKVFFIDEVNNAFGYGAPGPQPIQRFCNCAVNNWNTKPKYVLLWGDGHYLKRGESSNLISTAGFPASDHMLTAPLNSTDIVPQIPIGRLPIVDDSAGFNYLEKARIWADLSRRDPWMRIGKFAGGGASVGERAAISRGIENVRKAYARAYLEGDTSCYYQIVTSSWDPVAGACLFGEAGFRLFFGHSTSNIFEVPIYSPDSALYDDIDKSALLYVQGNYGADFTEDSVMAKDWLSYPRRGAVAWVGNSGAGYLSPLKIYSEIFMPIFATSMIEQPIGDVMKATIREFRDSVPGIQMRNHVRQMILLGDPSLVLSRRRYAVSIDVADIEESIRIYPNPSRNTVFVETDKEVDAKVKLLDLYGRLIQEGVREESRLRLSVNDLPAGTYVLRIEQGGKAYSRRLVVL